MFIELTDHLRCPADHAESFLVLLPDSMRGRRVWSGTLGCPACGRVVTVAEGVVDFAEKGAGNRPANGSVPSQPTRLTPDAAASLLGLEGPGGYLAVIGGLGGAGESLAASFPGIRLVLVNPPPGIPDGDAHSVVRADRSVLKTSSMRAVVLSADFGNEPAWREAALDAVLPGNPIVVEGPSFVRADLTLVAEAPGLWIGRKTPRRGATA